jgi:hypothetical protein
MHAFIHGENPLKDLSLVDDSFNSRLGRERLADDLILLRVLHVDPERRREAGPA